MPILLEKTRQVDWRAGEEATDLFLLAWRRRRCRTAAFALALGGIWWGPSNFLLSDRTNASISWNQFIPSSSKFQSDFAASVDADRTRFVWIMAGAKNSVCASATARCVK
jgi:hypothetical protein